VFGLIDENFYEDLPFSLEFLLNAGAMNHGDAITEISGTASGESQLEVSLVNVQNAWTKVHSRLF
jgi:hypothetical protein